MSLFLPITKVDAEQRLVYGTLSEEVRDKSDEILDYATAKPAFEKWSNEIKEASGGKSLGNVRAMHGSIAAGKFTDISYDDDAKRIDGCAKIIDDNEWNKVVEGVYTGFSIGGGYARRWPDPNNSGVMRYTPVLAEVSIVDNPCVPTATFEYIKADGSVEMRKFITHTNEDSMDPKALAAAQEALAKGTATDEQKALIAKAESDALLKAAQDAEAAGTATDEQKALVKAAADAAKPALVKDGKPVKPSSAPVQKWLATDGTPFDSKREAEIHNLHLEKQTELAPGVAQMDALLKGAKKPVDEDEDAEGDTDEEKTAKKARRDAKAAKAKKGDAEMAAKVAADELAKQQKAVADKAAADALAKGATDPVKADHLFKSLYHVGWMADLLSNLKGIQGDVEWEQMWTQNADSSLPAKFKGLVAEMCEVLVALVDENTKELIAGGTDDDVLAMAAKVDSGHASALGKMIAEMRPYDEAELKKPEIKAVVEKFIAVKEALNKAGARHSKSDKENLMAIHKSATDHVDSIEKCFKGMGIMDDDTDDKDTKKMSKVIDQLNIARDEVSAVTKVAVTSNEALLKAIPLIETLQKTNAELTKRMEHLEKQPAAPKGHVRVISKTQDGGAEPVETEAEYQARVEKMTPGQKAREAMKKAMSNPMDLPNL